MTVAVPAGDGADEDVEDADVDVEDGWTDEPGGEILWTSDDALTFEEARRLTSTRGATVVLFAGDTDVGKTTALAEVWTSLLIDGRLGGFGIAGSNNALAFERRSFRSRIASGTNETDRTVLESEGFLHLSVRGERGRTELLFADYAGERFTRIREGVEAADELPWVGRVDRLAVFVDGRHVASPARAEIARTRAERLLLKVRDCEQRNPRLRVAVVVAKSDLVDGERFDAFQPSLEALLELARAVDPEARALRIAARPEGGAMQEGLEELLDWICTEHRALPARQIGWQPSPRAFGRFR